MRCLLLLVLVCISSLVSAQPKLLKNFDGPPGSKTLDSSPEELTEFQDKVFFTANHPKHGRNIWSSDGTEAGTVMLKDLNPADDVNSPKSLSFFNGSLLFTTVGENGGVWKTDGTAEGTIRFIKQGGTDYVINNSYGPGKKANDPAFTISATSSSGLAVTYSVVSGPASISGNTVTINGSGSVTIKAEQGGNNIYNAAAPVERTFAVAKVSQTITFNAIPDKKSDDAPFAIQATASSGLPVAFSVTAGPATISGNTLTITGAGSVTVKAQQAGNNIYDAAAAIERKFNVELVLGLEDNSRHLQVFPNPASDKLYVQTSTGTIESLNLVDILGRSVLNLTPGKTDVAIPLDNLQSGVYVLHVRTSAANQISRIQVKH